MNLDYLTSRGFYVFPLSRETYKPVFHGWQELATNSPDTFRKGFIASDRNGKKYFVKPSPAKHILAVFTKAPLFIIDIDQHGAEKEAEKTLEKIIKRFKLPETFTVKTKRGGYHLYYNAPDLVFMKSLSFSSFKKFYKNVDLKVNNSYVVAPNGNDYNIINSAEVAIFPIAEMIQLALSGKKDRVETAEPQDINPEYMDIYERYTDKVASNGVQRLMIAAIGSVNNTLFSRTAALASFMHYGLFTRQQVGQLFLTALEKKAMLEGWADWGTYKPKAIATIKSAINSGISNPKYIIVGSKAKPLYCHDFDTENKQASALGFD